MANWLRIVGAVVVVGCLAAAFARTRKSQAAPVKRTLTVFEEAAIEQENHQEVQAIRNKARERMSNGG